MLPVLRIRTRRAKLALSGPQFRLLCPSFDRCCPLALRVVATIQQSLRPSRLQCEIWLVFSHKEDQHAFLRQQKWVKVANLQRHQTSDDRRSSQQIFLLHAGCS